MRASRVLVPLALLAVLGLWLATRGSDVRQPGGALAPTGAGPGPAVGPEAGAASDEAPPGPRRHEPAGETREGPEGSGPVLRGRLVDAGGHPVPDARVLAVARDEWSFAALDAEPLEHDGDRGELLEEWSEEDGRFALHGLAPGRARLAVRADGFAPLDLEELEVLPDGPTELGELALEAGLILAGRVVDARDAGIASARLARVDPGLGGFGSHERLAPLGHTDAEGRFHVHGLRPGRWTVRVTHREHPEGTFRGDHAGPGVSAGHRFELADGWLIEGRLVVPGLADLSGYRIDARLLDAPEEWGELSMGDRFRTATCAADGAFRFTGLRALDETTRYRLEARRVSGRIVRRIGDRVEAHAGQRGVLVHGEALATLRFELRARDTGAPVEDPQVWLVIQGNNHVDLTGRGSVTALGEGRYEVADVERASEGADFALHLAREGFRDHLRGALGLAPGAVSDLGRIELERPALLVLELVDAETGAPVADARVGSESGAPHVHEVLAQGSSAPFDPSRGEAQSGADGVVRLPLAIGHENRVLVAHPGYALPDELRLTPVGPGETARRIELARGAALLVRVLDGRDRPAAGEPVVVVPAERPPQGMLAFQLVTTRLRELTDAEGRARFAHLRPGAAVARLDTTPSGTEATVVLRAGEALEVELRAPTRAELSGVVRQQGRPLAGAEVQLVGGPADGDGDLYWGTETDEDGRFALPNVVEGEYELLVAHPARALPARRPVSVRAGAPPLELELGAPTRVTGRVEDEAGAPLGGAAVFVLLAGPEGEAALVDYVEHAADLEPDELYGDPRAGWARADEAGRYELRGLPAGIDLRVVAVATDHVPAPSAAFALGEGEARELAELVAPAAARLRVSLEVGGERAQRGWGYEVRASLGGGSSIRRREFAGAGELILDHLAPGTWRVDLVRLYSEEGPLATAEVELVAGELRELVLQAP